MCLFTGICAEDDKVGVSTRRMGFAWTHKQKYICACVCVRLLDLMQKNVLWTNTQTLPPSVPPPTDHWQLPDCTARLDGGDKYGRVSVCLCLYIGMWQWMICASVKRGWCFCVHMWICMNAGTKVGGANQDGVMSVNCPFCFFLAVLLSHLCLVTESYAFGWLTVFVGKF